MDYDKDQWLNLVIICCVKLKQAKYATKLVHRLYYDATIVDYNLIIKCF